MCPSSHTEAADTHEAENNSPEVPSWEGAEPSSARSSPCAEGKWVPSLHGGAGQGSFSTHSLHFPARAPGRPREAAMSISRVTRTPLCPFPGGHPPLRPVPGRMTDITHSVHETQHKEHTGPGPPRKSHRVAPAKPGARRQAGVAVCSPGWPEMKFFGRFVKDGNVGFGDYASSRHPVVWKLSALPAASLLFSGKSSL